MVRNDEPRRQKRFWGTAHRGRVDRRVVEDAIREVSQDMGLEVDRESRGALHAVRSPSLLEGLRSRPERIRWHISQNGEELHVTCDPHWSARKALGFLATCGFLAFLIGASFWVQGQEWYRRNDVAATVAAGLFLSSLVGWTWLFLVLGSLGGGRLSFSLWEPIRKSVKNANGRLEPCGSLVSRRWLWAVAGYVVCFFALISPVVVPGLGDVLRSSPGAGLLLGGLALLGLALLSGGVLLAQHVESGLRAEALLLGLVTSCPVLMWLLLCLPWLGFGFEVMNHAPVFVWVLLAGQILWTGFLFFYGLRLSAQARRHLERFQDPTTRLGTYGEAVRGGPALRETRMVFGLAWLLTSLLVLTGLVLILRPLADPALLPMQRFAWSSYAAVPWIAWLLSVGSWIYARRLRRRKIGPAVGGAQGSEQSIAREAWRELLAEVPNLSPRLVIEDNPTMYAQADLLGVWGSHPVVVLSRGACRRLTREELRALLSHELAHHLSGHVRKMLVMHLLGRITFVGDGFVTALQNSFGYEQEADEIAVAELGLDRRALGRALTKIRQVNAAIHLKARTGHSGLSADAVSTRDGEDPPGSALRFLLDQYFGWRQASYKYYYWHPLPEERERP